MFTYIKTQKKYILLCIIPLGWFVWHKWDNHKNTAVNSPVLSPDTAEKVIVNPDKHTLTVVTPTQVTTTFLPDRPSSIEVKKGGKVDITAPQFGTEVHLFTGLQASNSLRLATGADFFYYKKYDVGLGVANPFSRLDLVVFGKVTYNIWSEIQVGVTYDSSQHVGVGLFARF